MACPEAPLAIIKRIKAARILAVVTASLMMSACAQMGLDEAPGLFASTDQPAQQASGPPRSELEQATDYWGKQYQSNPRDLDNALSYAKNLKALGQKQQALGVLQRASMLHGSDRRLASEYGRLALELDQVSVAKSLLAIADDPTNPDWRVVLARGTVLAKEGQYSEAIQFFERANLLTADNPSVMNNLALAYTMSGEPAKGEELLRRAAAANADSPKIRQNLALVLGIQGKYDESTQVGATDLPRNTAQANADLLRKIVKTEPKAMAAAEPSMTSATNVAASQPTVPLLKPTAHDQSPRPSAPTEDQVAITGPPIILSEP